MSRLNMENASQLSLEDLTAKIARHAKNRRIIVAIAGPPGSGKSTTSAVIKEMLTENHGLLTQVVPMDGFHYDNAILSQISLIDRKGSPESFDLASLDTILQRLSKTYDLKDVAVPIFDREIDLSRASARLIDKNTKVLLVEGNYLLLAEEPWLQLRAYFDLSVMIDCNIETLRARLLNRWIALDYSEQDATKKLEENDIINAHRVLDKSRSADFYLSSE